MAGRAHGQRALAIPGAATARSSAQSIAFDEVGRQAIQADPDWMDGDYYGKTTPRRGLALALFDALALLLLADRLARILCLALLAAWIGRLLRVGRRAETPEAALILSQRAFMGFFLLAPTVYPWYLAWTLPFLCLDRSLPWLALTGTIFAFYAHDFAGHHHEIWWVTSLEYTLPLALAIGLRLRRPTPSPSSSSPP